MEWCWARRGSWVYSLGRQPSLFIIWKGYGAMPVKLQRRQRRWTCNVVDAFLSLSLSLIKTPGGLFSSLRFGKLLVACSPFVIRFNQHSCRLWNTNRFGFPLLDTSRVCLLREAFIMKLISALNEFQIFFFYISLRAKTLTDGWTKLSNFIQLTLMFPLILYLFFILGTSFCIFIHLFLSLPTRSQLSYLISGASVANSAVLYRICREHGETTENWKPVLVQISIFHWSFHIFAC